MSDKEENINLKKLSPVSSERTKKILYQMENCICKIYKNDDIIGVGFLCKILYKNNLLPVLVTNYHILNEKENDIKISINEKMKIIKKDNTRKKILIKDITFIEIKPNKDHIEEKNYMELDEEYLKKEKELEYDKKSIYILHYRREELNVSYGLIKEIKDEKIKYYCNIEEGSYCCPILSLKNNKIIGIYYRYSSNSNININYGILINKICNK